MNIVLSSITVNAVDTLNKIASEEAAIYPEADRVCVKNAFHGVDDVQDLCHFLAKRSGWWTDLVTGQPKTLDQVNIPEKLMLIVSEIGEAMEGHRKNLYDDKLPHRKMLEVELADAVIRILDLAGFLELDLAGAVIEKLAVNQQREDHKLENRQKADGKKF